MVRFHRRSVGTLARPRPLAQTLLTESDLVRRNDELLSAPIGEEVAMMDVDAGTYYVLDDITSFIWSSLAEPTRVADLLARLQERYDVTPDRCSADVLPLLERLHEKGIVRVAT